MSSSLSPSPRPLKRARFGPTQVVEEHKQVKLFGTIDWRIENFLTWISFKSGNFTHRSSTFEVPFQDLNKVYKFHLRLGPKDIYLDEPSDECVTLLVIWENAEKMDIKYECSLIDANGVAFQSRILNKTFLARGSSVVQKFISVKKLEENPGLFLSDGYLQIRCDFTFFLDKYVYSKASWNCDGSKELSTLKTGMQSLMDNAKFSDFTIVCGGETFNCHKCILANKSEVLEGMMTSGRWSESKRNTLKIVDFSPEVVKTMLLYIYCNEIRDVEDCTISLLLIGDKYMVTGLVERCTEGLSNKLTVENVIQVLEVADRIQAERLKSAAIVFISKHVGELYNTDNWKSVVSNNPGYLEDILGLEFTKGSLFN